MRTFWGELAWQLLGAGGYALVAESDERSVNPGSDLLRDLLRRSAPCLILIDEWVAYVRQLYEDNSLPAGSFETNLTFAQSLTEAVRAVPKALLVASLPSSDIEVGGPAGQAALVRLRNTFSRLESSWRPASAEEGFEIVRRRLFQPLTDPALLTARDTVVRAFMDFYRASPNDFPSACSDNDYERRFRTAYPIHPELFDRLYEDWSSLDKFQRTRGVLRLMALVIHELWIQNDTNLLIMPASIPIDTSPVQSELTHYLGDNWAPVIEKDVDGPNSEPMKLDKDFPNLGRLSAGRRVTRTIYMGSAPKKGGNIQGIDIRSIRLGCAQPGENIATFADALSRLSDQATHLYQDNSRYWFDTLPNVTRLAQDEAARLEGEVVVAEIIRRLQQERQEKRRGDFARVIVAPPDSGEVADEREVRLVILGPQHCHIKDNSTSPARLEAAQILAQRGSGPRLYSNTLVFLAADNRRLEELKTAVRQYLAWKLIDERKETLTLDSFQLNQITSKLAGADSDIDARIPQTYEWLLVPTQENAQSPVEWSEYILRGSDPIVLRACRKLRTEEQLLTEYAGSLLRRVIDNIPLWNGEHVVVQQLAEYFARYIYLPRLRDPQVLVQAIRNGVGLLAWETDAFAYADAFDGKRYLGLQASMPNITVLLNESSVLVRPEAARRQLDADEAARSSVQTASGQGTAPASAESGGTYQQPTASATVQRKPVRFFGSVKVDALKTVSTVGTLQDAIVQHLASLVGTEVEITLDIQARSPEGFPEHIVRIVSENCRTLRFESSGFEEA
ncbi:ATP-binding protein [Gloeobacter morelensis]|uniref:ATP-binding protein n=1 Tax=Gloeobacter morelensis TaxID=2907343 RepID=UPI003AB9939C